MATIIRNDLHEVESLIGRLLYLGEEFRRNNSDWVHLKNEEDWGKINRVSDFKKVTLIERIYSDGRDMAIFMSDALSAINYDFTRYPTLTHIVDGFKNTWIESDLANVLATARTAHEELGLNNWAFNQMAILFEKQINLANTVKQTLDMLRETNIYKKENKLPMENFGGNIVISNVSNSAVSVHSSGFTQTINPDPGVFLDLISALQASKIEERDRLVALVEEMRHQHKGGNFLSAYKRFMEAAATHINVIQPFIPALSSLL